MTAFDLLRERIRKYMNDFADDIATGAPADWASYKALVGKIEGLAIAERELLDIQNNILEEEEN